MRKCIFWLSVVALFACTEKGYEKVESGIEIKFIDQNKESPKLQYGNIVELDVKYFDNKNVLLFSSKELPGKYRIKLKENKADEVTIDNALQYVSVGDSASILLDAESFYKLSRGEELPETIERGSDLRFEIRVLKIVDEEIIAQEKKALEEKMRVEEIDFLDKFIKDYYPEAEQSISGMYSLVYEKGDGKKVLPGSKVIIHYSGKFLNGEMFDSSIKREKPFSFVLGEGQVIAGLEEGVNGKRVGDKIHVFIPSHLAYGEKGVKNFIAPFTTLHFELEILDVEEAE